MFFEVCLVLMMVVSGMDTLLLEGWCCHDFSYEASWGFG